jgi:hypothetical protein
MTLEEACASMQPEIGEEYNLGPGDAKDLFEAIWQIMVRDTRGVDLNTAIDLVSEELKIGF